MEASSDEDTEHWRKCLILSIVALKCWNMFLVFRQILVVLNTSKVPDVFTSKLQQVDFDKQRSEAIISLTINVFDLIQGAAILVSRISYGYPSLIWSKSAKFASSSLNRALVYTILEFIYDNWLLFFLILFGLIGKSYQLLDVVVFLTYSLVVMIFSAFLTYALATTARIMGPQMYVYMAVPLNIVEMLNIVAVILFVLPQFCHHLPENVENALSPTMRVVDYPISRICMIPENERSVPPNAGYVGLFGVKMIILTESLLKLVGLVDSKSVLVDFPGYALAHELGHWAKGHMIVSIIASLLRTIACSFALALSYGSFQLFRIFRFDVSSDPPHPVVGTLICWHFICPLISHTVHGVFHVISYFCEYEADHFAVDLGLGLGMKSALVTLVGKLNGFPVTDSWFAAWFKGHPDIKDRVDRILKAIS